MSQLTDDDSAEFDPLLLFANEPETAALPVASTEIPKEIEPQPPSPDLAAIVTRAEAAERSLRESKREVAALKRQMATLVAPAKNNRRPSPSAVAVGLAAASLIAVVAFAGRFVVPAAAPPVVAALAPARAQPFAPTHTPAAPAEIAVEPSETIVTPTPFATVAATPPLPVRRTRVRSVPRLGPEPRREYVGTLSVDAVPAGGEVFINRKSVGKTPVRLSGLRAGSHLVWIEREGYRLFTRVVLVPADQVSRVSVALEPVIPAPVRP